MDLERQGGPRNGNLDEHSAFSATPQRGNLARLRKSPSLGSNAPVGGQLVARANSVTRLAAQQPHHSVLVELKAAMVSLSRLDSLPGRGVSLFLE